MDNLRLAIKETTQFWRRYRDDLAELEAACQRTDMAPLLVWVAVCAQRRLWRRYLRACFGIVQNPGGFYIIKRRAKPPKTLHDVGRLTMAVQCLAVFDAVTAAYLHRGVPGVIDALRNLPIVAGESLRHLPHPDQREAAATSLAGWANANIRLYARIREALGDSSKIDELPAATFIAWAERQPGESLKETLGRAADLLGFATPTATAPLDTSWLGAAEVTPEEQMLLQELQQERELALRQVLEVANESERRLIRALLEHDCSIEQAATALGMNSSTARVHLYRLKQKLKKLRR